MKRAYLVHTLAIGIMVSTMSGLGFADDRLRDIYEHNGPTESGEAGARAGTILQNQIHHDRDPLPLSGGEVVRDTVRNMGKGEGLKDAWEHAASENAGFRVDKPEHSSPAPATTPRPTTEAKPSPQPGPTPSAPKPSSSTNSSQNNKPDPKPNDRPPPKEVNRSPAHYAPDSGPHGGDPRVSIRSDSVSDADRLFSTEKRAKTKTLEGYANATNAADLGWSKKAGQHRSLESLDDGVMANGHNSRLLDSYRDKTRMVQ